MRETLKQKLMKLEPSQVFTFQQIRDNTVELRIDGKGYCGEYTTSYAKRVCRELKHNWKLVYNEL